MKYLESTHDLSNLLKQAREVEATNIKAAFEIYRKAYEVSKTVADEQFSATCGFHLAQIYKQMGDEKAALNLIDECLALSVVKTNTEQFIEFHELAADVYLHLSQHDHALEHFLQIASLLNAKKDKALLAKFFNRIGDSHKMLAEYSNAIKQHEKALAIFEELNDKEQICITNYYIGNCYNWTNELDVAFNYLDKSLKIAEKLRSPKLKIRTLGSLAILFTKYNKHDQSLDYFFEAIDNANLCNDKRVKCDLLKSLGNLYNETCKYDEAIHVLYEGLEIANELNLKFPTNLIHNFLSRSYEMKGDFKKAFQHFSSYHSLSNEIQNEEINIKTRGLQLRYDLEEIKKEKNIAEQNLLLKDAFLANVSHEFRTPINGIIGMANLLSEASLSDEQKMFVTTIKNSAFRIIEIIDDILDYARLNTGQVKPIEKNFLLTESLNTTIKKLTEKAAARKIKLELTGTKPQWICGDAFLVEKIIYHVLNFSCAYADTEDIDVVCHVNQGSELNFKIEFETNTNKPLPGSDSIFDLNYPGFTDAGLHGYGLGLSLVNAKGFTKSLSGKINFTTDTKNCCFEIVLPFKAAGIVAPPIGTTTDEAIAKIKILLVDDNKVNQFLARTMLEKKGYQVHLASDGNEAIEAIKQTDFNLIITDVQMPEMNGYELAEHIRKKLKKGKNALPIIALTAFDSPTEKEKALEAGMSDYLTKPYNPDQLFEVIAKNTRHKKDNISERNEVADIDKIYTELLALMGGSKPETKNLIGMLSEQIPELTTEIKKQLAENNMTALYQAAHKLKSSVKLFKVIGIDTNIDAIEKHARENNAGEELEKSVKAFCPLAEKVVEDLLRKIS